MELWVCGRLDWWEMSGTGIGIGVGALLTVALSATIAVLVAKKIRKKKLAKVNVSPVETTLTQNSFASPSTTRIATTNTKMVTF